MIRLATATQRALLVAVTSLIDAGAEAGAIELYTGTMPAKSEDRAKPSDLLATIKFDRPAFGQPSGGEIAAAFPTGDRAVNSGKCLWARVMDSRGAVVFDCDVGEEGSGAAIELNTIEVRKGGPVLIHAFRLDIA